MLNFEGIDKNLNTVNIKDVIGLDTCLVIPFNDPKLEYPLQEYSEQLRKRFGIRIVIIGTQNNLVHPTVSSFWPDFVTVSTSGLEFIQQIKHELNLPRPTNELKKLIKCQLLFDQGKLIYSSHQPVQNHHANLLANKAAMKTVINTWGLHYAKFIMNQMDRSDQNFLWEPATNFQQASSDPDYYGKKINMMFVRYLHSYSLVPNTDLERILKKLKA